LRFELTINLTSQVEMLIIDNHDVELVSADVLMQEVQGEMGKCEQLLARAEEERGKLAAYLSEDVATFDLTECAQHLTIFLRHFSHVTLSQPPSASP
jgi:hypothetical protein